MPTVAEIQAARAARLAKLGLEETEFEEKFARASGPGGQNVNKVSTAVTIRHSPSGLVAIAQDSRSQAANRQMAWTRILDAIEKSRRDEVAAQRSAREKKRRANAPRPWKVKQRMLESKRHRSETKRRRTSHD